MPLQVGPHQGDHLRCRDPGERGSHGGQPPPQNPSLVGVPESPQGVNTRGDDAVDTVVAAPLLNGSFDVKERIKVLLSLHYPLWLVSC